MKKALLATFCITALFVLIILMFPFKENPVVETKTVSIQQEIVYAYVTTEMLTNGYGGVHGHQDYICYGVQDGDNILDKEDRMDFVTMRKSEKDHICTLPRCIKMEERSKNERKTAQPR